MAYHEFVMRLCEVARHDLTVPNTFYSEMFRNARRWVWSEAERSQALSV